MNNVVIPLPQRPRLRRSIRERLFRSDTWLLIAWLTLAGWSLDALRMFLEMHGNLQSGLVAFASHFWYAIPMAVAVVVLSRLKPKSRLLGAASYDESGRVLQQEGDCCLEELVAKGMVAALRDSGPDALQGLTLPSGASAYFVRQAGRTVVLSFSAPAEPEALVAGVRRFTADSPVAFAWSSSGACPSAISPSINSIARQKRCACSTSFLPGRQTGSHNSRDSAHTS